MRLLVRITSHSSEGIWRNDETKGLGLLLAVTALTRAGLWLVFDPFVTRDSGAYPALANQLKSFDLSGYDGFRTPGYPLFLILTGDNPELIWVGQMFLGVATAIGVYYMVKLLTGGSRTALIAGLAISISVNTALFEATPMTEIFTMFLVVSTLAAHLFATRNGDRLYPYILLGVLVSLLALSRPVFLIAIPIFLIAVWIESLQHGGTRLAVNLVAYIVPVIVLIGGWSFVVLDRADYFGISTGLGYNLTRHTGLYFEEVGDEHATIRDIYVEESERRGGHEGAIWTSRGTMEQATGMSPGELSRNLTAISGGIIINHPGHYVRSVSSSWVHFWAGWNTRNVEQITPSAARQFVERLWDGQEMILRVVNGLFLLVGAFLTYSLLVRRRSVVHPTLALAVAIVLAVSVATALVELPNARFAMPTQPVVVIVVVAAAHSLARWVTQRKEAA